ncbi:MAG: ABC transporter ATP-binding protein, partial [Clostridia bacterium]|nr:ABC transporter ATP-binding protein [Clostridia bacterium]
GEGELFAFLGVNGAGKSTSISIICGQLGRDSGRVYIGGKDIDKDPENMKRSLGVVFQNSALDRTLTVRDNLQSRAALYGICGEVFEKRVLEVSGLLEIGDILKRPVGKLSGGQRRKADIARALIHSPKILILDEPTTGLDPQSRKTLWNVISSLRKERSLTVLLTTHYMEEAAGADNVVIIDGGKIVAEGSPLALKNRYCGDFVTLYGVDELSVKALGVPYEPVLGGYRLSVLDTAAATALILANPGLFRDYEVVKGNMDHVFLAATGKVLGEPEQNLRRRGRR